MGLHGDHTQAMALRIAEDWLKKKACKFTPADVGEIARKILDALKQEDAG